MKKLTKLRTDSVFFHKDDTKTFSKSRLNGSISIDIFLSQFNCNFKCVLCRSHRSIECIMTSIKTQTYVSFNIGKNKYIIRYKMLAVLSISKKQHARFWNRAIVNRFELQQTLTKHLFSCYCEPWRQTTDSIGISLSVFPSFSLSIPNSYIIHLFLSGSCHTEAQTSSNGASSLTAPLTATDVLQTGPGTAFPWGAALSDLRSETQIVALGTENQFLFKTS